MAKSGIFKSLGYSLFVQPGLLKISDHSTKMKEIAKAVPASVFVHWSDTAKTEFPGIKTTPANFAVACSALLQFFHISAIENTPLMLPSKAADSVWHAWLAHDKEGLTSFLKTYLGQNIAHVEKNAMIGKGVGSPANRMAHTWRAAHDYEKNIQFHGKLPGIFEADKITGMPGGFWYDRDANDRRAGCFYDMNEKGIPSSEKCGGEMLSWPSVYNGMTTERRAQADRDIVAPHNALLDVQHKHSAILASLGFSVGIVSLTAAAYLDDIAAKEAATIASGDVGINPIFLSAYAGSDVGGGDGGGSSCGGG